MMKLLLIATSQVMLVSYSQVRKLISPALQAGILTFVMIAWLILQCRRRNYAIGTMQSCSASFHLLLSCTYTPMKLLLQRLLETTLNLPKSMQFLKTPKILTTSNHQIS